MSSAWCQSHIHVSSALVSVLGQLKSAEKHENTSVSVPSNAKRQN